MLTIDVKRAHGEFVAELPLERGRNLMRNRLSEPEVEDRVGGARHADEIRTAGREIDFPCIVILVQVQIVPAVRRRGDVVDVVDGREPVAKIVVVPTVAGFDDRFCVAGHVVRHANPWGDTDP